MMVRPQLLMVMLASLTAAAASNPDARLLDQELAREPASVTTTNGRTVRGILDGFQDGRLHLRLATDGGEVGYSFAPAEIAQLVVPGRELEHDIAELLDRGEAATALPMLEALCRHRMRYLPVLDAERRRPLWWLVERCSGQADPAVVLAVIRALAPHVDTPEQRQALLEAELGVAERMRSQDEVRELARRWCASADPSGPSALGWRVLAHEAYQRGNYDAARWLALQPVTFAGHLPMRDLDLCYAIAIATADRAGDVAHARQLRVEMAQRGVAWPALSEFAALGEYYAQEPGDPQATRPFFAGQASGTAAPRPAATDMVSPRRLILEPTPNP